MQDSDYKRWTMKLKLGKEETKDTSGEETMKKWKKSMGPHGAGRTIRGIKLERQKVVVGKQSLK